MLNIALFYLITPLPMFIGSTSLLPYRPKPVYIVLLYLYTILTTVLFVPFLGQSSTFIFIAGVLLIIWFSGSKNLYNLTFSCLGYLLSVLLNNVALFLIECIFKLTVADVIQDYYLPFVASFSLLLFLILSGARIILRRFVPFWGTIVEEKRNSTFSVLSFFLTLACTLIYIFNIIFGENADYSADIIQYNMILFLILFLFTVILLYFMQKQIRQEEQLKMELKQYEATQEYAAHVEALYMDIRGFKHDYVNLLSTMEGYISEQNWNGLTRFFYQNILPQHQALVSEDTKLGLLSRIHIPELKSLLTYKCMLALHSGIILSLDLPDEINPDSEEKLPIMDLVRLTGIFFDNALEAAAASSRPSLELGIWKFPGRIRILLRNSSPKDSLREEDLSNIFNRNFTTKGKGHGFGLYNASRILTAHPEFLYHISLETSAEEYDIVVQQIELLLS